MVPAHTKNRCIVIIIKKFSLDSRKSCMDFKTIKQVPEYINQGIYDLTLPEKLLILDALLDTNI